MKIPYGVKITPENLKPEWLKHNDVHLAFMDSRSKFEGYIAGRIDISPRGVVSLRTADGGHWHIEHVVLYPAPRDAEEVDLQVDEVAA
ncbi:hypothetical protein AEAC466_17240 [Asticcacaulis sp. AC466]|uniref:hypothetical protein n=1 Tax=Asticcacaulis sp. AC466 TaxID=1282362 RepID=UPI0003C3BADA|nr:hypothetical protein [Asticcacaulis sp. AC466]ESQ82368.1 hypothetical protein AEAC466_17240 [Asticcacaulis sp. AC466]